MNRTHTIEKTAVINGKKVNVRKGMTVLDASRRAGIYIPTLCFLENVRPYGGCRLCLVEIKGRKGYHTACTTPLEPGMEILTDTPALRSLRCEILELTLSEHPYTCLVCKDKKDCAEFMKTTRKVSTITGCNFCTSNGDCELQDLTETLGLKEIKYPVSYRGIKPVRDNPFYDLDYNLCILCGRCVRICNEERNSHVLAFVQRGNATLVGTAFSETQLEAGCEFCGACVDVCPTGSISEKMGKWAGPPDGSKETTCLLCSVGCTLNVNTRGNRIVNIGPKPGGRTHPPQVCLRGKFLPPDIHHHPERITSPLLRRKDKWVQVSWEEAIRHAAENLDKFRGKRFGMVCSGQDTLEDNYILQKFSRKAMRSNNIDLFASYGNRKLISEIHAMNSSGAPPGMDDIRKADTVFMVGTDASLSHPLIENRIRKAARNGQTLIYANPYPTRTSQFADPEVRYRPGEEYPFLYSIAHLLAGKSGGETGYRKALELSGVSEKEMKEIVAGLTKAGKLIIVAGDDLLRRDSGMESLRALGNIRFLKNKSGMCRILFPGCEGNHYAAVRAGVHPDLLPGFEPLSGKASLQKWNAAWETRLSTAGGKTCNEMVSHTGKEGIRAMMVAGDIPAHPGLANLEFMIQMNMFRTDLSQFADVIFPVPGFLEHEGHTLSPEGKPKKLTRTVRGPGKIRSIPEIISELAGAMNESGFTNIRPGSIWKEIRALCIEDRNGRHGTDGHLKRSPAKLPPPGTRPQAESRGFPLKIFVSHNHYRYRGNCLTGLVPDLQEVAGKNTVMINRKIMKQLRAGEGGQAKITTGSGEILCVLKSADGIPPDSAILTPGNGEILALTPGMSPEDKIFNARIEKTEA